MPTNVMIERLQVFFAVLNSGSEQGPFGCCCAADLAEQGATLVRDAYQEGDECVGCGYPIV